MVVKLECLTRELAWVYVFTRSKLWVYGQFRVWFSFLKQPQQKSAFFIRILSFFIGYHAFSAGFSFEHFFSNDRCWWKQRCWRSLTLLLIFCVFTLWIFKFKFGHLCIIWSLSYIDTVVCFVTKFDAGFFIVLWFSFVIWFEYYNYILYY